MIKIAKVIKQKRIKYSGKDSINIWKELHTIYITMEYAYIHQQRKETEIII